MRPQPSRPWLSAFLRKRVPQKDPGGRLAGQCPRIVITFVVLVLVLLATDLITKSIAFHRVAGYPVDLMHPPFPDDPASAIYPHDAIPVVPHVLALKLTINPGAIFGIGGGARWAFVLVSIVASILIGSMFWWSSEKERIYHVALAMLLAGALGNMYDRIRFGVVRDFFLLFPDVNLPFGLSWFGGNRGLYPWIFNVADVALVLGVAILFILLWRTDKKPQTGEPTQD